jgi:parallel beta-helix repeat protein
MVHRPATIHHRRRIVVVALVSSLLVASCRPGGGTGSAGIPVPVPDGPYSAAAGTEVGTTSYEVPSGAIVVSVKGNDNSAGTADAPYRTLNRAISRAASGATIVLRRGTYHESVIVPDNKRLTIQSWPKEQVWLDGSETVTSWTPQGNVWVHEGWTAEFDTSPTYTKGAPDSTEPGWSFVNASYPLAAYPDQLWLSGKPQRQVASLSQVTAGTFFHDRANNRLYMGSSPVDEVVAASTLQIALRVRGAGTVIRGIGIGRYAPSVPDLATVRLEVPNVTLEHVAVTDNSVTGIGIFSSGARLRNVLAARNGMLGITGSMSDDLVLERVVADGNNSERFNSAPIAGGAKFHKSRGVTIRDSRFTNNLASGLWFDQSNYNMVVTGNEVSGNSHHGVFLEISAKGIVANNLITDNADWGLLISNTSDTQVWNNTFVDNGDGIWLIQDSRRPDNFPGNDPRHYPDPTMTWLIGPATFHNNVIVNSGGYAAIINVQDTTGQRSAEQIGVTTNSNILNMSSNQPVKRLVSWARAGTTTSAHYTSLTTFRTATGQEGNGQQIIGPLVATDDGVSTSAMPTTSLAQALPQSIATLIGQPTGTQRFGAWDR